MCSLRVLKSRNALKLNCCQNILNIIIQSHLVDLLEVYDPNLHIRVYSRHVKLKPMCGPQNDIQSQKNCKRAAVWKLSQLFPVLKSVSSNLMIKLDSCGPHLTSNGAACGPRAASLTCLVYRVNKVIRCSLSVDVFSFNCSISRLRPWLS